MSGLTHRQRRAAVALAGGATIAATAAELGLSERTVRRWRARADFREALELEAVRILEDHRAAVRGLLVEAREAARSAITAGGPRGAALAVRVLGMAHLAAFVGGAESGAARIEHSGSIAGTSPAASAPRLIGPGDPEWVPP